MLIPETLSITYNAKVLSDAESLGEYLGELLRDLDQMYRNIADAFATIDLGLTLLERSSDPSAPANGESITWMSDGTGKGDAGDILIASTVGGVTKYATLFDHSAGGAW